MLRVDERSPRGREYVVTARAVPVCTSGPVRVVVGRVAGRLPEVPAPRPPLDDELCALAVAVGVMG